MKKLFILFLLISVFYFGCEQTNDKTIVSNNNHNNLENLKINQSGISDTQIISKEINFAQEIIAKTLSLSLNDFELRVMIKKQVELKFDGDFDVLFSVLSSKSLPDGRTVVEHLTDSYIYIQKNSGTDIEFTDAVEHIKKYISAIPKFQISVPIHCQKWEINNYVPLVTFVPFGIEDTNIEKLKVFDLSGNAKFISAKDTPEDPVVVVGVSERTDSKGNVTYTMASAEQGGGGGSSSSERARVYINDFRLMDDHEPWFLGNPEIYVKARRADYSSGSWTRTNFTKVNKEKWYFEYDYSWLPKQIYSTVWNDVPDYTKVEVWEDDDSSGDDKLETKWWFAGWVGDMVYPMWETHFDYYRSHYQSGRAKYEGKRGDADLWMYWETK